MERRDVIPVVVAGATGKMGRVAVQTILGEVDLELVGAVGHSRCLGDDVGMVVTGEPCGVTITADLEEALEKGRGGVLVDFSTASSVKEKVQAAIRHEVACVIGTTGISTQDDEEIHALANSHQHPVLLVPNFSLGAVLMMKFAREAARYYRWAEILEMHHEKKRDAPSGTARRTAELMSRARPGGFRACAGEEVVKGCRGGAIGGIRIHSVRLPGLMAHQQVLLGGEGETLTLRHDSLTRHSFMPGLLLAIHKVHDLRGAVVGLEHLLD